MTEFLLLLLVIIVLVVGFFAVQFNILSPQPKGLPLLMYHKISGDHADGLTITTEQFERQLNYLRGKGYRTISFRRLKEMVRSADALPKHTLIITFDDAYLSFRTLALPLLKKYGFSATVFVPVAYMGKTNFWDHGSDPIMSETDLRQLAIQEEIEIGLHSFLHGNYGSMTIEEMKDDLKQCRQLLEHHAIPFTNVLAYPYGGYPKKDQVLKRDMIEMFVQQRLDFATRIGNRINSWPIRHPYEIKRIDMKGTDSFYIFKTKLQKGHARLFA